MLFFFLFSLSYSIDSIKQKLKANPVLLQVDNSMTILSFNFRCNRFVKRQHSPNILLKPDSILPQIAVFRRFLLAVAETSWAWWT